MPTFRNDIHLGHKVPLVETDDLADGAVTNEKIADGAVTCEKISDECKANILKNIDLTGHPTTEQVEEMIEGVKEDIRDRSTELGGDIRDIRTKFSGDIEDIRTRGYVTANELFDSLQERFMQLEDDRYLLPVRSWAEVDEVLEPGAYIVKWDEDTVEPPAFDYGYGDHIGCKGVALLFVTTGPNWLCQTIFGGEKDVDGIYYRDFDTEEDGAWDDESRVWKRLLYSRGEINSAIGKIQDALAERYTKEEVDGKFTNMAKVFRVNFTMEANGSYICDKTKREIADAWEAGYLVIGKSSDTTWACAAADWGHDDFAFYSVGGAGFTMAVKRMYSDESDTAEWSYEIVNVKQYSDMTTIQAKQGKVSDSMVISPFVLKTTIDTAIESRDYVTTSELESEVAVINDSLADKASQEWVLEQIGNLSGLELRVVDELPVASAETLRAIYLVPSGADGETGNVKDEYVTIEGAEEGEYQWEKIGSTEIDLSGYETHDDAQGMFRALRGILMDMQNEIEEKIAKTYQPKGDYLTEHQDVSGKADVGDSYTKAESDGRYPTKAELAEALEGIGGGSDDDVIVVTFEESLVASHEWVASRRALDLIPLVRAGKRVVAVHDGKVYYPAEIRDDGNVLYMSAVNAEDGYLYSVEIYEEGSANFHEWKVAEGAVVEDLSRAVAGLGEPFRVKGVSQTFEVSIPSCTADVANTSIGSIDVSITGEEAEDFQIVGMIAYEMFDAESGGNRINCWPVCQFTADGQKTLRTRWMCAGSSSKTAKRLVCWVLLKHR